MLTKRDSGLLGLGADCQRRILNDVTKAVVSLQLNAGQDAAAEAAIHAMRDIFADVYTDAVLLILNLLDGSFEVENGFDSINRNVCYII